MKNFKALLLETMSKDIIHLEQIENEKLLRKEKALLSNRIKSLEKLFINDQDSLDQLEKFRLALY